MKKLLTILISILFNTLNFASHIKAGEILVRKDPSSSLKYTFDFILYYDLDNVSGPNGIPIDNITVSMGDGSPKKSINLSNQQTFNSQGILKATYTTTYTFSGAATYIVSFAEKFRIDDVLNMSNSAGTELYIESKIIINPFSGANISPILTYPPLDIANNGKIYVHNPGAYDPNGDSLHFELIPPKQSTNSDVNNYSSPANPSFGGVNTNGGPATLTINPKTGEIRWNTPGKTGYYNIAIRISEYRRGVLLGYIIRDMQIEVIKSPNDPPKIISKDSVCLEANYLSEINFTAKDTNLADRIIIDGLGSAFQGTNQPQFINLNNSVSNPYSGKLQWTPSCSLVQEQPYQIIIKATDEVAPSIQLSDVKTILAKVRGPRPIWNKIIKLPNNEVRLSWKNYSNNCSKNGIKLRIYRAECDSTLLFDPCKINKSISSNYKLIKELDYTDTAFIDNDNGNGLKNSVNYFYTIIAFFPESAKGVSYPSNIQKVSFNNFSILINSVNVVNQNTINLEWEYPDLTNTNPNYGLWIEQSTDSINFKTIYHEKDVSNLSLKSYTVNNLDLSKNTYYYRITYYANNDSTIKYSSAIGSSLNLKYTPLNSSVKLYWTGAIPFNILKIKLLNIKSNTIVDSTTTQKFFIINNLKACDTSEYAIITEQSYCTSSNGLVSTQSSYKLKVTPLVDSNIKFNITIKNNYCDISPCTLEIPLPVSDTIVWADLSKVICSKVVGYNIYFKSILENEFIKIGTTTDTFFINYNTITRVGCYIVKLVTLDNFNNATEFATSNELCINNDCYCFSLPNIITPNNDGLNDFLIPLKFPRFVKNLNFKIYNRWGTKIFETQNQAIKWDASNVESGVYFYEVNIEKYSLDGQNRDFQKGYVTVSK